MLSQLSCQSHVRAVVCGLALMFSGHDTRLNYVNSIVIDGSKCVEFCVNAFIPSFEIRNYLRCLQKIRYFTPPTIFCGPSLQVSNLSHPTPLFPSYLEYLHNHVTLML